MPFQRLDDARIGGETPSECEMEALTFFSSEVETGGAFQKSPARRMESTSLTDFPSEASVPRAQTPPSAAHARQLHSVVPAARTNSLIPLPAARAAPAPKSRAALVPPRDDQSSGACDTSFPRFRGLAGTARPVLITAVVATLGAFIGITAIVRPWLVFEKDVGLVPRQGAIGPIVAARPAPSGADPRQAYAFGPVLIEAVVASDVSPVAKRRPVQPADAQGARTGSAEPAATRDRLSVVETKPVEQASPRMIRLPGAPPERLTFRGALSVDAEMAGARVYVDGRLVGFTPMSGVQVTAGSHVVRIEHDGYERWSSVIRVVAEEGTHLTAKLRPISPN
jgi:hypothetical protein